MKKAKLIKSNKKEEMIAEETYSVKKLFYTVILLVIIFGVFYLITTLVVHPKENEVPIDTSNIINTKDMTLNNLFDQEENEYYVLASKTSDNNHTNYKQLYDAYLNEYTKKEDSLKVYKINLSNAINRSYLSDSLNISDNLRELKLTDDTLFKIKDKTIESYFVGNKEILEELLKLKES